MPLRFLHTESDDWLLGCLALYRRLDRQARATGLPLSAAGASLLAQYEAEAARRGCAAGTRAWASSLSPRTTGASWR